MNKVTPQKMETNMFYLAKWSKFEFTRLLKLSSGVRHQDADPFSLVICKMDQQANIFQWKLTHFKTLVDRNTTLRNYN